MIQGPGGRDRPNARGDATRLRLLIKAEELFAERGISTVPLRDIGLAAGQKNNVAVQYHFSDRESLVREIFVYRSKVGEAVRAELLAELLSRERPPQLYDIVGVVIRSMECHLEEGNHYLAFLSRYVIERGDYAGLERLAGGTLPTLVAMTCRLLPDVPRRVVDERWMVMGTSAVHSLARYQTAFRSGALPGDPRRMIDDLVLVLSAGMAAPRELKGRA